MGIFLEKSGAAKRMAITILKLVGVKRADVVLEMCIRDRPRTMWNACG